MKSSKMALMIMRATVLIQLITGIALWMGRWAPVVDPHRTLGIVYVFALWFIAGVAIAHKHNTSAAGFAIMWGVLIITVGFAQQNLLPGELHWVTRVAHLLVGLLAIPMAEALVKGAGAPLSSR